MAPGITLHTAGDTGAGLRHSTYTCHSVMNLQIRRFCACDMGQRQAAYFRNKACPLVFTRHKRLLEATERDTKTDRDMTEVNYKL